MSDPRIVLRPAVFSDVPTVRAAFSTRHGGVSTPPYASLNLGDHVGDDPARVATNRSRFCARLGRGPEALATAGQVHGAEVATVTAPGHTPFCDGLVTDVPGVVLAIAVADCAAVLLADPQSGVVGACHAGWRGAVAGVVRATVAAMTARGATPAHLRAYISPCIGPADFEVGPEVAAQFDAAFVRPPNGHARPHVDLPAALQAQLVAAGVPPDAIGADRLSTLSHTDRFFSYRAADGPTGRMFGAIVRQGPEQASAAAER
ncbi:peptidoglycan editing factor PgeF [Salisaeta longa]|uniref:peptidoglycan editing factor PgeF n=1 Tax=Salisaeta longa TaxID=503170 RepID=UPI0003B4509E|nr:peptidoglycan editing factor PgeF [Salisaeta longa]